MYDKKFSLTIWAYPQHLSLPNTLADPRHTLLNVTLSCYLWLFACLVHKMFQITDASGKSRSVCNVCSYTSPPQGPVHTTGNLTNAIDTKKMLANNLAPVLIYNCLFENIQLTSNFCHVHRK